MRINNLNAIALYLCGLIALSTSIPMSIKGESSMETCLNPVWHFHIGDPGGEPFAIDYDDQNWDVVSLPHSHRFFSVNMDCFAEHGREVGWYRREFQVPASWKDKRLFLEFQGAMEAAELWVNGRQVGRYEVCGFDSFDFDITKFVREGNNLIVVRVDNRVQPDIPPDGLKTDYVLFGGLYRDVFLHVTDPVHITFPWEAREAGVRVTFPSVSKDSAVVEVDATVRNDSDVAHVCILRTEIQDTHGNIVSLMEKQQELPAKVAATFWERSQEIWRPHLWSPEHPYLYKVVTKVLEAGRELDRVETHTGIRWVKFDKGKGFFLNGDHAKLIGINCHQTWPFIGAAVPNGLHRRDAEQIKAMGANWVRLSHYPQDPDFLDALDELGLMAIEEPPTWMDRGSEKWMANLEASFRSMIRRDRNHPAIIMWNACINHQGADPALVRAAKEEDPTRDRGQDTVPTPMDFARRVISGNGALTVEYAGHMFPTMRGAREAVYRVWDGGSGAHVETNFNREFDQAERHWEQVNAAYQKADNSGVAGWCMYDYNTFHNMNENGLVSHGICDLFRIPKYTYWWYTSELTEKPMLYIVRINATRAGVFSNCEKVRLLKDQGKGWEEIATQAPDTEFTAENGTVIKYALHHPPFQFTVPFSSMALKAEGLNNGRVAAVREWKQFGSPVALTLEADRPSITADGADLSRIIVTAVDKNSPAQR